MKVHKSVLERLIESGVEAASRAARLVADSDRARDAAAAAVGLVQRGKQRLDAAQEKVLHLLGFAAREDYAEVAKRMARLKRKVRDLSRQLAEEGGRGGAGEGQPGPAEPEAGTRGGAPGEDDPGEGGARR